MFTEFINRTSDKDDLETETIICQDCVLQLTLKEFRRYLDCKEQLMCHSFEEVLHCVTRI